MGLKLNLKKNQIHFTIKKRSTLWTKDFFIGISLALSIHLIGFTFFHIDLKGFLNPSTSQISLPVSSDLKNGAISYLNEDEKKLEFPSYLQIQRASLPISFPISFKNSSYEITASIHSPLGLLDLHFEQEFIASQADFHLSHGHVFVCQPTTIRANKICRAKLEFKADVKTGQIFWVDFLESTQDKYLDAQIIQALKAARLKPSTSQLAYEGVIEVEFQS